MLSDQVVILFVVNDAKFFLSHRLPLAIAAREMGYDVHVATPNSLEVRLIQSEGFTYHEVPFSRSGQNPIDELETFFKLIKLFKLLSPSILHLVTIKPVLYGGIAARFAEIKCIVCAISGLGSVFIADSIYGRMRRWIVARLYRAAFKHKLLAVIFQNPDDRDSLLTARALKVDQVRMIHGSGVSLIDYPYLPEPTSKPVVVMAARILKDKGVCEFVEAARLLKQRLVSVDMRLIGSIDSGNPTSLTEQELNKLKSDAFVTVMGFQKNIADQYAEANIVCLPSYREGLPKSLVEAAACGRAVVTTDVPGCRDAITPDITGLLVPVKDTTALANAIQKLVEDTALRHEMGRKGRALAEEAFAIEKIVMQHMAIYKELMAE